MLHPDHPSVGRELKHADLKTGQTVWCQREGLNALVTLRVQNVSYSSVSLHDLLTQVLIVISADGDRFADSDRTPIALYEYTGKTNFEVVAKELMHHIALHLRRAGKASLN
jgi:hypothetical protein